MNKFAIALVSLLISALAPALVLLKATLLQVRLNRHSAVLATELTATAP